MNYLKAAKTSQDVRENSDCSVKAVSILCDVPYIVAHRALKQQGRENRRGAHSIWIIRAMHSLGFAVKTVYTTSRTMATISRDPAVQKGFYAVMVKQHIASVVNGVVEDWTAGRRHKIMEVIEVTPYKTRKERKQCIKDIMAQ